MQEVIGSALRKGEMQNGAWEKLNCDVPTKASAVPISCPGVGGDYLEGVDPK